MGLVTRGVDDFGDPQVLGLFSGMVMGMGRGGDWKRKEEVEKAMKVGVEERDYQAE